MSATSAAGASGFFYSGVIWGLKDIADYAGRFYSIGGTLGAGVFGAGISVFASPSFSTHGIATGFTFGTSSIGASGQASRTWFEGPWLTGSSGYNDVLPYLLAAWPFPQNLLLAAKAKYNS